MTSGIINSKLTVFMTFALALPALAGCLGGEGGDGDAQAHATYLADCMEGFEAPTRDDGGDTGGNETGGAGDNETQTGDGTSSEGVSGIVIGTLLPLTGGLEAYGPAMEQATDLAAKHLTEAGADVTLAHEDSASDPNQAPQAFNKLVNQQNVVGVVGAASSGVTSTLMSPAGNNEVLLVSPASTSPELTADKASGYFFRVVPSDALQGSVMAGLIQKCGDGDNVNTIAINNDYGKGFVGVMGETVTLGENVYYAENQETFDSEVQSVCSGNPSAIAFIGYPREGGPLMQAAYAEGCTDIPWYFSEGLYDTAFVENAGNDAENTPIVVGYGGTRPWSDPNQAGGDDFASAFQEEFGNEPGLFAAESYDATVMIALAAEIAGGTDDGAALVSAMESLRDGQGETVSDVATALEKVRGGQEIDWAGPAGQFTFDENHSPAEANYAVWAVAEDGSLTTLASGIQPGDFTTS